MTIAETIRKTFREYRRYTGDGLPGEPTNAPLPIGDPQSGVHNPSKAELRDTLGNVGLILQEGVEDVILDAQNDALAVINPLVTQAGQSAASALQSATSAAAFDPRYLGSKAVAPTTDNSGNALVLGALYWDSGLQQMQVWNGTAWASAIGNPLDSFQQLGVGAVLRTSVDKMRERVSVKDFGAVGDGVADDTAAIQAAITYACTTKNIGVFVPAGSYCVTSTLNFSLAVVSTGQNHFKVDFYGEGHSSQIIQQVDGPVFAFSGLAHQVSFRDFTAINKTTITGSGEVLGNKALFYFPDGNSQSHFQNITYSFETSFGGSFYVCGTDKFNDTVSFINCVSFIKKWGYKIGKGSSVFIYGGRVIGSYGSLIESSVGLYFTGGNGGCWIWATDFILCATGILVSQDSGQSNREIFLTHTCVDSSNIGLDVIDISYVTWVGVWAASSDSFNINYAPPIDAPNALLNISGGTIFNAGYINTSAFMYGLSVNQNGRINITGVTFRFNKGRAISFNSVLRTSPCNIQNCLFYDNGNNSVAASTQVYLAGRATFTNNELIQGTGSFDVPSITVDPNNSTNLYIADNRGYQGQNLRNINLALGASNVNVLNTSGQRLTGYIRGGTVNSVWVNDFPVYDFGSGSLANCQIVLNPGDRYKIVYTVAPNIVWYFN